MSLTTRINERRERQNEKLRAYRQSLGIAYAATSCLRCATEIAPMMMNDATNAQIMKVLDRHDNGQHGKV